MLSGVFTRIGTDIGYREGGDDTGIEGEKRREWKNGTSDARIEEMRALVNLEVASRVKIDRGGGSRFSVNGNEERASSTRSSETDDNLVWSAD